MDDEEVKEDKIEVVLEDPQVVNEKLENEKEIQRQKAEDEWLLVEQTQKGEIAISVHLRQISRQKTW